MTTVDRSDLSRLTVKELREKAEAMGLKNYKSLKKAELVDAIAEAAKAEEKASSKAVSGKKSDNNDKKTTATSKNKVNAEKASDAPAASAKDSGKETKPAAKVEKVAGKKAEASKVSSKAESVAAKVAVDEKNAEADEENAEVLAEKAEKEEKPAEENKEVLYEPDSVFIDHGAVIPEFCPGTRLRVLVRDPGTIFVYWDSEYPSYEGWLLTALDRNGNILDQFRSFEHRSGRGYFHTVAARVARVSLAEIHGGVVQMPKLQSKISLSEQITAEYRERWINIHSHEIVAEAPAPGRAPNVPEFAEFARFDQNENANEYQEMVVSDGQSVPLNTVRTGEVRTITRTRYFSTSSWFGSETEREFIGIPSSDSFYRRK